MKASQKFVLLICLTGCFNLSAFALNLPFLDSGSTELILTGADDQTDLKAILINAVDQQRQDFKKQGRHYVPSKQAQLERETLIKALRAQGYYAAKVKPEVQQTRITHRIDPGPRYTLAKVSIQSGLSDLPTADALGLRLGQPFVAQSVLDARAQLRRAVEQSHCLWQIQIDYDATVFHDRHEAELIFSIEAQPELTFGAITLTGLKRTEEPYLKRKLGFEPGDCFKRSRVDKARLNLYQSGLISNVESTLTRQDDQVAVQFDLIERKPRTVKAGAGYSSDEGAYVTTGWTHRNLFGEAETLNLDARISELYQTAGVNLTLPDFYRPDQSLILAGELSAEHLEAFDSNSLEVSATLKRQLDKHLAASVGTRYRLSEVDDMGEVENYGLWSFPVSLSYDRRNDHLNPTQGWFLSGGVEPFVDTLDTGTVFVKTTLGASAYHTQNDWAGSPTFAARAAVGTLNGQSIDSVPADERFYAGGGGSVRGYAYQLLGPLDDQDEPIGGRSFAEVSLETRWLVTPKWGAVVFLDGGNAYESITPSSSDGLRWAVGAGARYFTDFAPIRMDIAVPLDRRDGVDDSFQFYISIGQAF